MSVSCTEENMQQHMHGRPHLKRLQQLRVSEKSVYIRGFSADTTSEVLRAFLDDQVGQVGTLWLSDNVSDGWRGNGRRGREL